MKERNGQDRPEINIKIDHKNYNKGVDIKKDLNHVVMGSFRPNNSPYQAQIRPRSPEPASIKPLSLSLNEFVRGIL